jgi:hypothetical protein
MDPDHPKLLVDMAVDRVDRLCVWNGNPVGEGSALLIIAQRIPTFIDV